jgi:cation:H+ antiporter
LFWILFLFSALVIFFAGTRLSRYGDRIATETGLGGEFIGLILLGTITSLPELAVSATSILAVHSPDLAVGGLLGSNTFNLAIIVLLDILYRTGPLLARVHREHILSAGLGSAFIGIVVALILYYQQGRVFHLFGVGLGSFLFVGIYLLGVRMIYRFGRNRRIEALKKAAAEERPKPHLRAVYWRTAGVALAIIVAGTALSISGDRIAEATGWGRSFVGSLLLAAGTSLPELAVSLGALRLGAVDLAMSNLLGSNLFNMVQVAFCDVLDGREALLAAVSPANTMVGLTALVMTGIVITALAYRAESESRARVGAEAVALILTYVIGSYFVFVMSRS